MKIEVKKEKILLIFGIFLLVQNFQLNTDNSILVDNLNNTIEYNNRLEAFYTNIVSKQREQINQLINTSEKQLIEIYNLNELNEDKLELIKQKDLQLKQKELINPTYKKLQHFIRTDKTDLLEWTDDFDCTEFSYRFINNFAKQGYYATTAEIDFNDGGHMIVIVNTTDRGLYYVEPQTDNIFSVDEMRIGMDYCSIVGWNCDWNIDKISNRYGVETK